MSGVVAKAIYDNVAESNDELEFKRGDIVQVLEQNTSGLEGWWLCALQGRQGIAPGNRLRVLPSYEQNVTPDTSLDTYDVPQSHTLLLAKMMGGRTPLEPEDEYDVPRRLPMVEDQVDSGPSQEIYDVPRASPWVDEEVYDVPTNQALKAALDEDQEIYNVPSNLIAVDQQHNYNGVYDIPPTVSRGPPKLATADEEVYDVPPRRRGSCDMLLDMNPNDIYDVPTSLLQQSSDFTMTRPNVMADCDVVYDVPQSSTMQRTAAALGGGRSGLNSLRRMKREFNESSRGNKFNQPPQSQTDWGDDPSYVYDIPPQVSKDPSINTRNTLTSQQSAKHQDDDDVVDGLLQDLNLGPQPTTATDRVSNPRYSTLSKSSSTSMVTDLSTEYNELPLSFDEALKQLINLKKNVEDVVSQLLTFVHQGWRKSEHISRNINAIKRAFCDILLTVKDFVDFSHGAYSNTRSKMAVTLEERAPSHVQEGFRRHLKPLKEDFKMLQKALNELETSEWNLAQLVHEDDDDSNLGNIHEMDSIGSFVMTSRAVSDDVGQMAIYIHTHAQYIFDNTVDKSLDRATRSESLNSFTSLNSSREQQRPIQEVQALQARPLPAVPPTDQNNPGGIGQAKSDGEGWLEDYDYVSLQNEDDIDNGGMHSAPTDGDSFDVHRMIKRGSKLKELEHQPVAYQYQKFGLKEESKHKVLKLEIDIQDLMVTLSQSIQRVLDTIEKGNAPKDFVGLTKAVILSAHKIVLVSECIKEKIELKAAQESLMTQCHTMCNTLKRTVSSTKSVVLHWPSSAAVHDMVDRLIDIATCANQIKIVLYQIMPM